LDLFIFFLGVEATWHNDDLHLSQQRYIHDLLTKTNMLLAKLIATLMSASTTFSHFEGSTITDPMDPFNISHLLVLTLPLQSIKYHSLCKILGTLIGQL